MNIISHETLSSPIIVAATWTGDILLYCLNHLKTSEPLVTILHESFYACSLLIRPSAASLTTSGVQLIAGLSDGTMTVYDLVLSAEGGCVKSTGRKSSGLGSRPLRLFPVKEFTQGEETVVAVGITERMSVIFENKGRIDFSSVNKKVSHRNISANSCLGRVRGNRDQSFQRRLSSDCDSHRDCVYRHYIVEKALDPNLGLGSPIADEDCQFDSSQAARCRIRKPQDGSGYGRHDAVKLFRAARSSHT